MRNIIVLLLTIFISTGANAKCASNGIYLLSNSPSLNKNGLIILEFYAYSQLLVHDLNKKFPVYLHGKNGNVRMIITDTLKGDMQVTQVVLSPATDLVPGEQYTLHIDQLPDYEQGPVRYNLQRKIWEALTFTITSLTDTDPPVLNDPPVEIKKTLVVYGCGPASWVYFKLRAEDKSTFFAKASIKNKSTGKTTEYIIAVDNNEVRVGHGMCSGGFDFEKGEAFDVSFTLIDQSGNKGVATKAIAFKKPTVMTTDER